MALPQGSGATVTQIWDELVANTRVAASLGQRLKDAVGLDTFTAARITDITKISSAAIAAGDTANSIAQKVRGMTDNQAVATAGITVTNQTEEVSTAENITTTETPPAASLSLYKLYARSIPAAIATVEISANSGTNYADYLMGGISLEGFSENLGVGQAGAWWIPCGATGRWRYTTPATVGTYIVATFGASLG